MIFNPIRNREASLDFGLRFDIETVFDPKRPMGNVACSGLTQIVYYWLTGLQKEAVPLISRVIEWLNIAIEGKEENDFGESSDFHRHTLYWAKALGLWMLGAENDKESYIVAMNSLDNYFRCGGVKVLGPDKFSHELQRFEPNEKRGIPIEKKNVLTGVGGLDDFMALAFQAEEYEAGIAKYEEYCAAIEPQLKKTLMPRELGYALCLHHSRGLYAPADLVAAGRKMLQSKLEEEWLGSGQSIRAASWLKVIYWHFEPNMSPLETLQKAYDNMPNVSRPKFV